jgi:hypothetical protein
MPPEPCHRPPTGRAARVKGQIDDLQKWRNVNVNGPLICGTNYMIDCALTSRKKFNFFMALIRGTNPSAQGGRLSGSEHQR